MTFLLFQNVKEACGRWAFAAAIFTSLSICSLTAAEDLEIRLSAVILSGGEQGDRWTGDAESGVAAVTGVPLYFQSAEKVQRIEIPYGLVSPFFFRTGGDTLTFFHQPPLLEPDAPAPSAAASINLPPSVTDTLLIFRTEDFDSREFSILALDNDPAHFPAQSLRLINGSKDPLALRFGDDQLRLEPGQQEIISYNPDDGSYRRLQIAAWDEQLQQWTILLSQHTRLQRNQRIICLILQPGNSDTRAPTVHFIRDDVTLRLHNLQQTGDAAATVGTSAPDGR